MIGGRNVPCVFPEGWGLGGDSWMCVKEKAKKQVMMDIKSVEHVRYKGL